MSKQHSTLSKERIFQLVAFDNVASTLLLWSKIKRSSRHSRLVGRAPSHGKVTALLLDVRGRVDRGHLFDDHGRPLWCLAKRPAVSMSGCQICIVARRSWQGWPRCLCAVAAARSAMGGPHARTGGVCVCVCVCLITAALLITTYHVVDYSCTGHIRRCGKQTGFNECTYTV